MEGRFIRLVGNPNTLSLKAKRLVGNPNTMSLKAKRVIGEEGWRDVLSGS